MPPVPALRPRQVIRAFEHLGWQVSRQRGSHVILNKPRSLATCLYPNN
ncbi:MAG: type II toxin-antitoxin system HicA family toxin [Bryobacterales bacterium]|nr:type II toxin-antitoxin system HicA family toxin [Bryobacterales bacterium]